MSFVADPKPGDVVAPSIAERPGPGPSAGRSSISVFCTDDHAGFRDVLRDLISATPGFVLIGEASSGAGALALVPRLRPDVVMIDVHMPGISGYDTAAMLARDRSDLLIVLMSGDPIEVPPGLGLRDGNVALVTKEELCPRRLLDLWHDRRPL